MRLSLSPARLERRCRLAWLGKAFRLRPSPKFSLTEATPGDETAPLAGTEIRRTWGIPVITWDCKMALSFLLI